MLWQAVSFDCFLALFQNVFVPDHSLTVMIAGVVLAVLKVEVFLMFRQAVSLTVLCRSLTVYSVVFLVVLLVNIFNVMASIPFDCFLALLFITCLCTGPFLDCYDCWSCIGCVGWGSFLMFRQAFSLTVFYLFLEHVYGLVHSLTVMAGVSLVVLLAKIFNVMASCFLDCFLALFQNVFVPAHSLTVMIAGVFLVVLEGEVV